MGPSFKVKETVGSNLRLFPPLYIMFLITVVSVVVEVVGSVLQLCSTARCLLLLLSRRAVRLFSGRYWEKISQDYY